MFTNQTLRDRGLPREIGVRDARLTGGRLRSLAISVFLIAPAWSRDMPLTLSVMYDDEAMAEPQPNVLNLTSEITPALPDEPCSDR